MLSHIGRLQIAVLLGSGALLGAHLDAKAAPAPPYPLLLQQARASAPRLAQLEAEVAQAEGLARQGAVRPNPVLGLEVENFGASRPYRGLAQAETTASVAQTFELGGKRSSRTIAGRAAVDAARARTALARADFAGELALAYADAEGAALRAAIAEELLATAESDARVAREFVDAGREAEVRALQAAAERDSARAELAEAQAARIAAFARLSALAGVDVPFDAIGTSLLNVASTPPSVVDPTTPGVIAARAERDAAAARVRVERAKATPDVTVQAGVRRLSGDDATTFVASASLPFPIFDRNRGATQAAQAELTGAEARLRQVELEALASLRSAQSQLGSVIARIDASAAGEAAAAEAYRLARIGYEAGRIPLLELTSARRAAATARNRTLDARLARVRLEAEIARLTGRTPFGG